MKNNFIILVSLFLFAGFHSYGQKIWTLEECVQYAVSNNLDIKSTNIRNQINKENFNQSKRNLLPYVSLGSDASNSYGRSLDYTSYEYVNTTQFYTNFNVSAGIDLFRGFTKQNTISYQKLNYLAGIEDEKQLKFDIAFNVMEAYYNTVYFYGLIEIVREQKELSVLTLKQAQKQADLGLKAKSDLLELESRLAKEELILIQTQNYYKTSLLTLQQAMNIFPEEEFSIDVSAPETIVSPANKSTSEIYSAALNFYPAIKAGEIRKSAAEKDLSITKGNLWPRLSMGAGTATNYAALKNNDNTISFSDQFKNNAYQYVGLSLNIPLFERFGLRSEVKKAKLNILQVETVFKKTSQKLYNEITQNYQELESFEAEYVQLVKQVDFAAVAFNAAEKKMAQGLINTIELYDSKNILAQAKSDLLRTKLQYTIKKKTIGFYMGEPVFKFLN